MTAVSILRGHHAHADPGHPERPARLDAVVRGLEADPALGALPRLEAPPASRAALERVHPAAYLDLIETFCETGGGALDPDTYATPASYDLCRQAVGNVLGLVDAVLEGRASTAFALARPPGHHARPMQAMGFCLLANPAVAARHAQAAHGAERVLVVDLDAHHGNGTQEAFYDDPAVLVVSSHQGGIFPGGGGLDETGAGPGEGATVNLPVPAGTSDELVGLLRDVLPPIAERHRPDLVLLSFGTDAHRLDPLAGLALSVTGLAGAATVVLEVADQYAGGRLVATLEGGYHVEALAASVAAVLHRMLDPASTVDDPFGPTALPGRDLGPLTDAARALHGL